MLAQPVAAADPDEQDRYTAYLARHRRRFADHDDQPTTDPLAFAAACWDIATTPVMSPPYVRLHPRVLSHAAALDDDGALALAIDIATGLPTALARLCASACGWQRDWPDERWHDPLDHSRLTALARVTVKVPIPADAVARPRYRVDSAPQPAPARQAIDALCRALSTILGDTVRALDDGGQP